ncbi:hypothetical protein MOQ72_26610 [Saccharopolyspora sp. K220]|uniref:hypothetical protein n=1 Tax=Saccharopolyspora soli TaxID=2926618 RepID=UPI001F57D715|nr:hypothetical protein [Saccharopolyspora soli]MCI2421021.1 hypothetical protein [Saccharopolyspora soli]
MSTPEPESPDHDGAGDIGETWTDPVSVAAPEQHRPLIELRDRRHRHLAGMQTKVLYGIGLVVVLTLLILLIGVGFGAFSENFGLELLRTVLPPSLAAGATIVGTLFALETNWRD